MGKFGALLRILKRSYDVSHEKLGWRAMNFGVFRELYFATFLRFGIVSNSNFRLYRDLTAQSGKPDETPRVIPSKSSAMNSNQRYSCAEMFVSRTLGPLSAPVENVWQIAL